MKIVLDDDQGITITLPELQTVLKGKLDGKDYPVMLAGKSSNMTNAFAKTGPTTLKIITKMNGKVFSEDIYTLSADGKTLTDESIATATKEKTKFVFDAK